MLGNGGAVTKEELERLSELVNAAENPIRYLSVDPGKANGVCGYDARFHLIFMYTIRANDMIRFLHSFRRVRLCVVEDFKLYPQKARQQIYSDMETSRVIGRIEDWAELKSIILVKQPASIKPIGYKWLGIPQPKKSDPTNHQQDAHVHFMYWAIKNNKIAAEHLFKQTNVQQN